MIERLNAPCAIPLPPIVVTRSDHDHLRAHVDRARGNVDASIVAFLERELDRAEIRPADMVPPDVVTMNTRVIYRRHPGFNIEMRVLVYDEEDGPVGAGVPVLSPLGVALLGLRAGDRMPYASLDGGPAIAVVERVAYQPEAEGRFRREPYRYWPFASGPQRETPPSEQSDDAKRVVPIRPRPQPQPRPARPTEDDDPPPNRAA